MYIFVYRSSLLDSIFYSLLHCLIVVNVNVTDSSMHIRYRKSVHYVILVMIKLEAPSANIEYVLTISFLTMCLLAKIESSVYNHFFSKNILKSIYKFIIYYTYVFCYVTTRLLLVSLKKFEIKTFRSSSSSITLKLSTINKVVHTKEQLNL